MKAPERDFRIFHDDRLEELADALWCPGPLADPLARECVVTHHRIMESWLRHHFVYDWSRRPGAERRVLANVVFQPLHHFVNEWLYRMGSPGAQVREPRYHPYSVDSMQWRIYGMIRAGELEEAAFQELRAYLGEREDPRRAFQLADQLAKLLETYTVYRPLTVRDWERGKVDARVPAWQPELWRRLVEQDDRTYLRQFLEMDRGGLRDCGIRDTYQRVSVFAAPTMPPVYLHFLGRLAEVCPVRLFVFNPCREYWLDDLATRDAERLRVRNLEGAAIAEESLHLDVGNPLLSSLGGVARELIGEIVERFELSPAEDRRRETKAGSVLQRLQSDILHRQDRAGEGIPVRSAEDDSLGIHVCHSPLREVEVLQDHIWRWFEQDEGLQPRDIQVQVTDLDTYAPYIEAVFGAPDPDSAYAIPYAIGDSTQTDASQAAQAFTKLLELPDSRFKADEVMDLLAFDLVRTTFGLEADQVSTLRGWVSEIGINWGRDPAHREQTVQAAFGEGSWQQGLDRVLLGYALGSIDGEDQPTLIEAGALNRLAPFDRVEGTDLDLLDGFFRFHNLLREWTRRLTEPIAPDRWGNRLHGLIDAFLVSHDPSYREVVTLREAVRALVRLTASARITTPVPLEVVRSFMRSELEEAGPGESLLGNTVVFSALRAGATTPRRIICLLGLNDGVFPRVDNRPRFDLLRRSRQSCDPSRAKEDRLAFLEALLGSRERLHLSYAGRSSEENDALPPSIVLAELKDYLAGSSSPRTTAAGEPPADGSSGLEVVHRLHPFHPDYFRPGKLFSYSEANQAAAARIASSERASEDGPRSRRIKTSAPNRVSVATWIGFFMNPARYYYRELLRARVGPEAQAAPPNSELFEWEGLAKYQADQEVVKAILGGTTNEDRTRVLENLQQRGWAPLGEYGRSAFDTRWSEISSVLTSPIGAPGIPDDTTLARLLGEVVETKIHLPLERLTIEGQVRTARCDGELVQVRFRHARVKAKDELRTWLSHLLLCAQGLALVSLCAGSEPKEPTVYLPVAGESARETLNRYVELFRDGHAEPLRFAPETSKAWVVAVGKDQDPEEAAGKKWESSRFSRGDGDDPYNLRAFGPEGPMGHERFGDLAEQVLAPMLDG